MENNPAMFQTTDQIKIRCSSVFYEPNVFYTIITQFVWMKMIMTISISNGHPSRVKSNSLRFVHPE